MRRHCALDMLGARVTTGNRHAISVTKYVKAVDAVSTSRMPRSITSGGVGLFPGSAGSESSLDLSENRNGNNPPTESLSSSSEPIYETVRHATAT